MDTTTSSMTEEAFLLRSLKEVVNVWAMGSGQASFSLNIINGKADLKLGFQLGLPTDIHLPNQYHVPVLQPNIPPQYHQTSQGRRKTPSQRRRDQARAAQHRATSYQPGPAVAAAPSNNSEADSAPAVLLPFSGKILPLHHASPSEDSTAPATAIVASSPPSNLPIPAAAAPTKAVGNPEGKSKQYIDASTAKKNLFPSGHQPPPPQEPPPSRSFQKREEDMWKKLFSI